MIQRSIKLLNRDAATGQNIEKRPGSTEPARVPIIKPSKGVNPIVVAIATPPLTAVAEQPFLKKLLKICETA